MATLHQRSHHPPVNLSTSQRRRFLASTLGLAVWLLQPELAAAEWSWGQGSSESVLLLTGWKKSSMTVIQPPHPQARDTTHLLTARPAKRSRFTAPVVDLALLAAAAGSAVSSTTRSSSTSKATKAAAEPTTATTSTESDLDQATASATRSTSATKTSSTVSTSTSVPSSYILPRAFDSTLGTNFTSTACPSFFATFLADPDFIACTPFSLLLASSAAFFTAQQSPYSLLPYVLDASCGVQQNNCSAIMDGYAREIKAASTCGPDLTKRNPLVVEALSGFENYKMMYTAGCLQNNQTGDVSGHCLSMGQSARS